MENHLYRLSKERWFEPREYNDQWAERNLSLLNLMEKTVNDLNKLSFSEYGCGPKKPFSEQLGNRYTSTKKTLDMTKWDDQTIQVDLDKIDLSSLPKTDVGVLSGVVEYLKSPKETLRLLQEKHQYCLLSYRTFDSAPTTTIEQHSKMLNDRAKKGWRNHLTLKDLLNSSEQFGYLLGMGNWQKQSLLLLKKW